MGTVANLMCSQIALAVFHTLKVKGISKGGFCANIYAGYN